MSRYFLEVSYKGSRYAGFQIQDNANTIQAEVEKALKVYFRSAISLTGSSRTDAGVHAAQNYFHFDFTEKEATAISASVYHLNAILPNDIVIRSINQVEETLHCRFDAKSRSYQYTIYQAKDPFLEDRAYYFPYKIDIEQLKQAASVIKQTTHFEAFSKRNVQVNTYKCDIIESNWNWEDGCLKYRVKGNRFLRGMVRGLVGTMLKVGTGKINLEEFKAIIASNDVSKVDFSTPAQGLMLMKVEY